MNTLQSRLEAAAKGSGKQPPDAPRTKIGAGGERTGSGVPETSSTSSSGISSPGAASARSEAGSVRTVRGSTRSRFSAASLQAYAIESLLSISAAPPRLPVAKRKVPLSLPTTTSNFRGFVQKSGPLFYLQDGVEATLMWDDWWWSGMWMGIWAVLALYPYLLLCAPSAILTFILIRTHEARFPNDSRGDKGEGSHGPTPAEALSYAVNDPTGTGTGTVKPPLVPNPPHEGTVKYYENLRDIQNMMRLIIDSYDGLAPTVPYLNWSSYTRTLLILQASILATITMFWLGPYLPIRLILLFAGEGLFIMNHPWTEPAISGILRRAATASEARKIRRTTKELGAKARELVEMDRLADEVWEHGWKDVEIFENERFFDPTDPSTGLPAARGSASEGWSAHNLLYEERKPWTKGSDGWSAEELEVTGYSVDISRQVAMSLEPGWKWVNGDDWRIDWTGAWSTLGTDEEGYLYTDGSWTRPAPYAYGHPNQPRFPPSRNRGADEDAAHTLDDDEDLDEGASSEEDDLPSEPEAILRAPPTGYKALTRRRRWLRRAMRVNAS